MKARTCPGSGLGPVLTEVGTELQGEEGCTGPTWSSSFSAPRRLSCVAVDICRALYLETPRKQGQQEILTVQPLLDPNNK